MSQQQRKYNCNSCNNKFLQNELSFKHGQALMTMVGQKDDNGRDGICLVSIKAWRNVCGTCIAVENRLNDMHINESKGKIIELSNTNEWQKFCDTYYNIAIKNDFGVGKCPLGQYGPFRTNYDNYSWYKYGKYKTYRTLQFFTFTVDDEKEQKTEDNNNMVIKKYDSSGARTTQPEFQSLVDCMIIKNFKQVHSKSTWFKDENIPEYMKGKGYTYRSPDSYDRLLGRVKKAGQKHFLFKNNEQLWKDYNNLMKQIQKGINKKYHSGTTKTISIQAAKDGLFEKDRRLGKKKGKDIISDNLEQHKKKFDEKKSIEEQKMINMQKQTEILGDIGKGLCMMSMMNLTVEDVWGDVVVWVTMEFEPARERQNVISVMGSNKVRFVSVWKVVMKGGDKVWPKQRRNTLITNTINQLKAERNTE
eukprot:28517_1